MAETPLIPASFRQRLPFRLQIEPRLQVGGRWLSLAVSFSAVIVALILGGILIALVGGDPIRTYAHIAEVSFGSKGGISDTLTKATPFTRWPKPSTN